jgi:hypothetical protein
VIPNQAFPIVNDDGTMSDAFRTYLLQVDLSNPVVGSGSPEGVVEARQYQFYINSTGTSGTLLYIKMLPEIGGDRSQGWVAV